MRAQPESPSERERYRILIDTIDRTVADIRGEASMTNADLYKGFSAEKQAEYEAARADVVTPVIPLSWDAT